MIICFFGKQRFTFRLQNPRLLFSNLEAAQRLTFDLLSQLPRERRGADEARRRAAASQNPAEVGPAPGGDARDGQLQPRDAGGEGLLVRRRGPDRQPGVPHQQGAPGQDPPGVRTFPPSLDALGAGCWALGAGNFTSIPVVVLELTFISISGFLLYSSHSLSSLFPTSSPLPRGPGDVIGDCKVQFLDEIYQVEKPGSRALSAADGQFKRA